MYDITKIVEAVLYLIGIIITTVLIPYISNKSTEEQQVVIMNWVRIAVSAAEQIFTGTGRGAEKKAYVIEWLAERNIKYNSDTIDAMIESAVYELINSAPSEGISG